MVNRYLFLDDDPHRHRIFAREAYGTFFIPVWTAQECQEALLKNDPFDCVFLDHDLGGQVFVKEVENTGTQVALFIRDELPDERFPTRIIIHSHNPAGAIRMENILKQTSIHTSRVPFGLFHLNPGTPI